ncbi:MFS transporter [Peteryoungia desertarenae]|nr:MFS transporter [Peteryoungia desertarenae]
MADVIGSETVKHGQINKGVASWMMFDWAAQPFFTVVTTFIFGPYFVNRMTSDSVAAQTAWSTTATIAGIIIAVLAPILGSIADKSGSRKPWIAAFAVVKILSLSLLWTAAPGAPVVWVATLFILATVAAEFSIVFNDSMMPRLVNSQDVGRVSNIAWGLGYLGGMLVLISIVLFVAGSPETGKTILGIDPLFGLDPEQGEDARITGPISALWYLVFILPMFLFTPDAAKGKALGAAVSSGLREIRNTLAEVKTRPSIFRFLIARMIYQDGVNGILILGGVFAAAMFGWSTMEMGIYGIILNIVAIFGCLIAGRIDLTLGSKTVIIIGLLLLLTATLGIVSTGSDYTLFGLMSLPIVTTEGLFATPAEKAYIVYGVLIGLAFGPVQASSRSYLARSVSIDESGRYFGLYALSGRATSFLATLSFSVLTAWTASPQIGMASMIVFLGGGLLLLIGTPYPAKEKSAAL